MKELKEWLGDKKRTYASGVEIFKTYGTDAQKSKYLQYFEKAKNPRILDSEFTILVNVLSRTQQLLAINAARGIAPKVATEKALTPTAPTSLAEKLDFSKIKEDELSPEVKDAYLLIKDIRPKQAALHAKLKDGSLSANIKIATALELIELEKARVSAWKVIETHFAGESVELTDDTPADANALIQKGLEAAKRIKQLSQNITNAKNSVKNAKGETAKAKANKRLAAYQKELDALTAEYSTE